MKEAPGGAQFISSPTTLPRIGSTSRQFGQHGLLAAEPFPDRSPLPFSHVLPKQLVVMLNHALLDANQRGIDVGRHRRCSHGSSAALFCSRWASGSSPGACAEASSALSSRRLNEARSSAMRRMTCSRSMHVSGLARSLRYRSMLARCACTRMLELKSVIFVIPDGRSKVLLVEQA